MAYKHTCCSLAYSFTSSSSSFFSQSYSQYGQSQRTHTHTQMDWWKILFVHKFLFRRMRKRKVMIFLSRCMCVCVIGGQKEIDKFILVIRFQLISLEWINHQVNGSRLLFSVCVVCFGVSVCVSSISKLDININWQLNIMNAPFPTLVQSCTFNRNVPYRSRLSVYSVWFMVVLVV